VDRECAANCEEVVANVENTCYDQRVKLGIRAITFGGETINDQFVI
jgi:hypothetical protein